MKKATIKPATAEQILRAHGISKKREAEVLARYAAAKNLSAHGASKKPAPGLVRYAAAKKKAAKSGSRATKHSQHEAEAVTA